MNFIFALVFKLCGWKVNGSVPPELKKYIIAVGPHTSNWDFPMGVITRSVMKFRNAKFLAKSSLFKFPYGWIFRLMGGYPVERSKSQDMTSQVADIFNKHEYFIIGLAPEGTRQKVERLRTGFWYIAKKAKIPIVPLGMDWAKKEIVVGKPIWPGNDIDKDLNKLIKFYKKITGKNPEFGIGH